MKISPLDVQHQVFERRLRGYDREQVRSYLSLLAEELAQFQGEHQALLQEAQHLRTLLEEHRERETILKNTLLTAQRVSEEITELARKQGQTAIKEAELEADKLLELAQARARAVELETLDLRAMRRGLRTDLRAVMERVGQLLDLQEEAEAGDNLRILKRREGGEA